MCRIISRKHVDLPNGGKVFYITQIRKSESGIFLPINIRLHVDKNGRRVSEVSNDGRWYGKEKDFIVLINGERIKIN